MKKLYRFLSILTLSFCLINVFNDPIKVFAADPVINFPDPVLHQQIAILAGFAKSGKALTDDIHQSDLSYIVTAYNGKVSISNKNITDLTGMEGFNGLNLKWLSFDGTNISDLTPLSTLTTLTELDIINSKVQDVTPISYLTNLTTLYLDSNNISDISSLRTLSNLTLLSISSNNVSDISVVSNFMALQRLDGDKNPISDLTPLSGLTNLKFLYMTFCNVSNIEPLANLTNLQQIDFSGNGENKITDITPLKNLNNLFSVKLRSNLISDISVLKDKTTINWLDLGTIYGLNKISDISVLSTLTGLTQLDIGGNRITDLSPISGLPNLTTLYTWYSHINQWQGTNQAVISKFNSIMKTPQYKLQVSDNDALSGGQAVTNISLNKGETKRVYYNLFQTNDGSSFSPFDYNTTDVNATPTNGNIVNLGQSDSLNYLDITGSNVGTTTVTALLYNINAEYTKYTFTVTVDPAPVVIKGSITIKYQDENGTDIGAPDILSNLDMGSYTENAKSFPGYVLNDSSTKSVTLTDSNPDQTIIFNYKAIKGSITIKYQDENGTDLQTPDVLSNLALGSYTEFAKVFPGYILNNSLIQSVILTDSNPDQTIVFRYKAIKGSITIKYQDENGTDLQTPDVISNLDLGSYTENAKSFPGYVLNDSSTKSVTLTDNNPDQTIVFSYKAIKGSITIKYQDENGTDLQTPDVLSNLALGNYMEFAKTFPGYILNNSPIQSVILTDSNPDQTIVFSYKTIKGSITIKYQDENGTDLQTPDVISNLDLGSYTENAKNFPGYVLNDSSTKSVTLTDNTPDQTIIFRYKVIKGNITIKYQDESGKDIQTPDVLSNLTLGSYTENARVILGYNLHDALSKTVTLTYSNFDQIIIFSYAKIKGSITVKYQDENGKDIQAPDVLNNLDMGIYTEAAKTIPGYELNDTITKVVILDDINPNKSIIFNYKLVKGTIEGYVKDNSGRPLNAAKIELEDKQISTLTDSTGYYKFSGVDMGNYTVRILDVNYKLLKEINISLTVNSNENPVTKTVDNINSASQNLNISHKYNRQEVDFILVPADETPLESTEILPYTGFPINTESLSLFGTFMALIGAFLIKFKIKR